MRVKVRVLWKMQENAVDAVARRTRYEREWTIQGGLCACITLGKNRTNRNLCHHNLLRTGHTGMIVTF